MTERPLIRAPLRARVGEWFEMAPVLAGQAVLWAGPPLLGLALFLGLWQWGHLTYGAFILPSPMQTLRAAFGVLTSVEGWVILGATILRVMIALTLSAVLGGGLGLLAGYGWFLRAMLAPVATILLGIPATAWVILTMIWFGPSHGAILFTMAIVTGPILYIGTVDAVLTRDRRLEDMAASFGAGRFERFRRVALRQILATLAPVLGITLALGFKVAIMAELVSNVAGIGAALAKSRAHMDIDMALAYVALAVMGLLAVEHGIIRPMQRRAGQWRRIGS
ncbi:ABC transporter permease [Rhodalgimonas zhirmunskyi]|uniref:ABC transporter permease subunit n=1 Tax=Rhodalgimonas zhirmunskyi TaxID=2964767 RepID=A0AAJ1U5K4_9RHOB|nr:ABC transporter permease subunit [Rhodoalgimonas zhirmunskyi]MDQ2094021.1 ABC transporter permease subunit [Rhodoalgimonas zhirmunskyi]